MTVAGYPYVWTPLGARVSLRVGDEIQTQQLGVGGAYLSHNDTDLHFGLGDATKADEIVIDWPDGTTEIHEGVAADQIVVLTNDPVY